MQPPGLQTDDIARKLKLFLIIHFQWVLLPLMFCIRF